MKFYFIRHGETLWNTKKIFQGSSNSPLTAKGECQAKKLGQKLNNVPFDIIYTSPLGRAVQTAQLVRNNRDIKIEYLDEFKEISVGEMEGIQRDTFEQKYPKQFHDFFFNPKDYSPELYGGETYYQLIDRVQRGLNKIISQHKDTDIVAVVSHGVTLKAIFKIINNISLEELGEVGVPKNTSLSVVDYTNGKYHVEIFSDISHLKGCD